MRALLSPEGTRLECSPDYAFRILGDDTTNASFLTLVGETTIDGQAVSYHFDGTYTDVAPVPLPASIWMLLSGIGVFAGLGLKNRRSTGNSGGPRLAI